MSETVQESEISLTIMSDKLTDTGYIDQMLVTTKLQILGDISKTTNRDLYTLVEQHCKEAFDYPELVKKYKLPVSNYSKPKKLKLKMRRSKKSTTTTSSTTPKSPVAVPPPDPVAEPSTPKSPVDVPQPEPEAESSTPKSPVAAPPPEPEAESSTPKSPVAAPQPELVTVPSSPKSPVAAPPPGPEAAPIKKPRKRRRKEKAAV